MLVCWLIPHLFLISESYLLQIPNEKKDLKPETNCVFSIIFNCRPPKRKWGGECKIFVTKNWVLCFLFKSKFLQKNSYFYETASFTLFTVKLSQWIKLSQNDIIAKMFLLSLVSHDYDIICKYVPHTQNEWAINIKDHICIFKKKTTRNSAHSRGDVKPLTQPLMILPLAPLPFSVLGRKRAIAVRFHMYCSIIQAINAN